MSLSCSCDYDGDEPDWYWWPPKYYTTYKKWQSRLCICKGCKNRVSYGDTVSEVTRSRPATEWEEERDIASFDPDAITIASVYMCERCTDLFFSFQDLGFECVSPYEDMIGLAKEYHDMYGGNK